MTVALGFHCTDGVVLAADSEISNNVMKYQGDKAWIYKYPSDAERFELQVGIVGAGDASFIQYAAERIDASLGDEIQKRTRLTMAQVNSVIQGVVNELHHTHLYPVPPTHDQPRVELIIGIWLGDTRNRLAKTYLTAMTKVWNYDAVGIGSALANFIIKRFYGGRVTVSQAVFIATQVLMHVKDNVPACGGQSKVIAMFKRGDVGFIRSDTISDHEGFLKDFDGAIAPVFFGGTDETLSDQAFNQHVDALSTELKALRRVANVKASAAQVSADVTVALSGVAATAHVGSVAAKTGGPSTPSTPSRRRTPKAKR